MSGSPFIDVFCDWSNLSFSNTLENDLQTEI